MAVADPRRLGAPVRGRGRLALEPFGGGAHPRGAWGGGPTVIEITETLIGEAARALAAAAGGSATVILFGSHADGLADARSDLDFLVIEDEVPRRAREIVRLQRVLSPFRVAADVLVISRAEAACPERAPDAVRDALIRGRVIVEAAPAT